MSVEQGFSTGRRRGDGPRSGGTRPSAASGGKAKPASATSPVPIPAIAESWELVSVRDGGWAVRLPWGLETPLKTLVPSAKTVLRERLSELGHGGVTVGQPGKDRPPGRIG